MGFRSIRALMAALAALWLALAALPAGAMTPFAPGYTCHASAGHFETYARVAQDERRWTCEAGDWSIEGEKALLRFDLRGVAGPLPTRFITRLTRFADMHVTVLGRDGNSARSDFQPGDVTPATGDWLMSVPLPQISGPVDAVIVEVHRPRYVAMFSDGRLGSDQQARGNGLEFELFIAALCGMLCMPLLFNLAFYQVLRERFLLWHAAAVCFMLVQTLVTSGVINRIADLSIYQLSILSAASFGGGVVGAALFAADLMEKGTVDPVHRRALRVLAFWIPAWTAFYLFSGEELRAWTPRLYYLSWLPVMAVMVWVMSAAKRRGSRAVNFQILAWSPFIVTGLIRVFSALGLTETPLEMQSEQHLSIAFEVIVTALGVADRFLVIKRQRDSAWAEARLLEDRIERDPLTGLLNRHAIENRYQALHAQGFRTIALLDLDRFKDINDTTATRWATWSCARSARRSRPTNRPLLSGLAARNSCSC
jgi:hypothetical protein